MDDSEVADIDPELHRRRAEEDRQISALEPLLPLDTQISRNLARMFRGGQAPEAKRALSVERDEIVVASSPSELLADQVEGLRSNRVGWWRHAVAIAPSQAADFRLHAVVGA